MLNQLPNSERANLATHAAGVVLGIAGTIWLLARVANSPQTWLGLACLLYGISLIGVFLSSTLSHWFPLESRQRQWYRRLDQAFIYFLIVATYTPLSMVYLTATWWWCVLGLMWVIAVAGFASKMMFAHRVNSVSIWLYLILGWLPGLAGMPFSESIPAGAVWGIVGGGVLYTLGTYFLFHDRRYWFYHAIWHLFVIAGAAVHFLTLAIYAA